MSAPTSNKNTTGRLKKRLRYIDVNHGFHAKHVEAQQRIRGMAWKINICSVSMIGDFDVPAVQFLWGVFLSKNQSNAHLGPEFLRYFFSPWNATKD